MAGSDDAKEFKKKLNDYFDEVRAPRSRASGQWLPRHFSVDCTVGYRGVMTTTMVFAR